MKVLRCRCCAHATAGADDGELFLERKRSEAIVLDDGRIKTAAYDASEGFGLRAVRGEVAGYAHSTEISETRPAPRVRDSAPCRGRWWRHVLAPSPQRHEQNSMAMPTRWLDATFAQANSTF
jgi:TldD protein